MSDLAATKKEIKPMNTTQTPAATKLDKALLAAILSLEALALELPGDDVEMTNGQLADVACSNMVHMLYDIRHRFCGGKAVSHE